MKEVEAAAVEPIRFLVERVFPSIYASKSFGVTLASLVTSTGPRSLDAGL